MAAKLLMDLRGPESELEVVLIRKRRRRRGLGLKGEGGVTVRTLFLRGKAELDALVEDEDED